MEYVIIITGKNTTPDYDKRLEESFGYNNIFEFKVPYALTYDKVEIFTNIELSPSEAKTIYEKELYNS